MMSALRPKGRTRNKIDWDAVDELILKRLNLQQVARQMHVGSATLDRCCRRDKKMPFGAYARAVRLKAGQPKAPFSVLEIKALLTAYYGYTFAKQDNSARMQLLRGIRYWPQEASTTGKSLFDLLTYPQLHTVMERVQRLPCSIDGVTVRDGLEYVLRVWIDPRRMASTLPKLMVFNERPERMCWEPNALGHDLLKQALVAFDRELHKTVLSPPKEKPHGPQEIGPQSEA